jgi:molybdate transport system substrate-binding protein
MPTRILAALLFLGITVPGRSEEILVFAAASLTESLQELGRSFETATGDSVRFSFGASSDLARQIRAGAPADVFFSADTARMDELERDGRVARRNRREFLSNSLVVIVPAGSSFRVRDSRDLLSLPRIALADPAAVPAGIYAKKWLEAEGLWDRMSARVVPTLDVRAALAAVETEAAPAGIVYKTDARVSKASGSSTRSRANPRSSTRLPEFPTPGRKPPRISSASSSFAKRRPSSSDTDSSSASLTE